MSKKKQVVLKSKYNKKLDILNVRLDKEVLYE